MQKLKAILWDIDGTLANTEIKGHKLAFNKAFEKLNIKCFWNTQDYIDLLKISGGRERLEYYAKISDNKEIVNKIDDIITLKKIFYQSIMENKLISLRTGVNRLIEELHANKIEQYLVTTSSRKSVETTISSLFTNREFIFKDYICSEDVIRKKPDPEAYLIALKRFNLNYKSTIAIEDSVAGLKSAKGCQLTCIITLSPWNNESLEKFKKADLVVNHLGEPNESVKIYHGKQVTSYINYDYLENLLVSQ